MKFRSSKILQGAGSAFLVRILGQGLMFVASILLARAGGPENYGLFVLGLAWLNVAALVGKLGFDSAVIRFLPEHRICGQWERFYGLIIFSQRMVWFGACALSVLSIGVIYSIPFVEDSWRAAFIVAFATVPVVAQLGLNAGLIRGLKRVAIAQFGEAIVRPIMLGVFAGAAVLIGFDGVSADRLLVLNFVAISVGLFVSILCRRALIRGFPVCKPNFSMRSEWMHVAFPLMLLSGMQIIVSQSDVIMVGALLGSLESGGYSVAVRIVTPIGFGLVAVNAILAPIISERFSLKDFVGLQKLATEAARINFLITVILAVVVLFLGRWLLSLFGPEYLSGFQIVVVLAAGQLLNAMIGSVGYLMTMTGYHRQALLIMISSAIANIILNYLLIKIFGVIGAAYATVLCLGAWNVLMWWFVRRVINIESTIFGRKAKQDVT